MAREQILVVEDEASIAEPLARALEREGFSAQVAATGAAAERALARSLPDLVLLDVGLPDADGRDLARELRRRHDVPIILVTARGTETDRISGLELGADDYVVKPFAVGELVARIRAVLRRAGPRQDSGDVLRVGELEVDADARRATVAGRELELSRKEFDLLAELARNAGRVVSRDELMDRVWDPNWFGSTKTLDVHVGWLRRKLGDDATTPRYIETVRGVGFRMRKEPASGGR